MYMWNLKKKSHRKRDQITRDRVGEQGNWTKVVKRYKLSILRQISIRNVTLNVVTMVTTAVWSMGRLVRVNPKSSHHKEKKTSFFLTL